MIISGINTLFDLAGQDDVAYGAVEDSSATVILSKLNVEPYATLYTHLMDNLVPNSTVGVDRVRNSYGIKSGKLEYLD